MVDLLENHPWGILVIPLIVWCAGAPFLIWIFEDQMTEVLDHVTFLMYVYGAVIIAAIGGFGMALAWSSHGGARSISPEMVEIPRGAVPEQYHPIWAKLRDRYGGDFASWVVLQADPDVDDRGLEWRAADHWPEWKAASRRPMRNEQRDARREAAIVVVGLAFERAPAFAVIAHGKRNEEFYEFEHSHTRFLMTMPPIPDEDESWNAARTAAAGAVVDRERLEAARGDHRDLAEVRDACLAIVAGAKPPSGYAGELTLSALTARALQEAGEILERHDGALRAIAHELASHRVLGGRELLRIFRDHPAADL